MLKKISHWLLVVFFVAAGANHFISPKFYLSMMPPYLPWPLGLVYISGAAEIAGGIGVLIPATRRFAGWGLVALLIAVFPANIHLVLHGTRPPQASGGWMGDSFPHWLLWARLPLQIGFIAWVYWTCLWRSKNKHQAGAG